MGKTIKFRRGTLADIPNLEEGEPGWVTDAHRLVMGGPAAKNYIIGNHIGYSRMLDS